MAQAQVDMSDFARDSITKHGFQVSTSGSRFVLRDPLNKKLGKGGRIESGNLDALVSQAERDREEKGITGDAASVAAKAAGKGKGFKGTTPAQTKKATGKASAGSADGDEINASEIDTAGGKVRKVREKKAPRDPASLKTRAIVRHIINNPEAKSEVIKDKCQAEGLTVVVGTVNSLRATVKQTLHVLHEMGWLKEMGESDADSSTDGEAAGKVAEASN